MNWRPGNTSKVMNGKIGSLSALLLEENNLHLQYCSHVLLPPQLRELLAPFVFFPTRHRNEEPGAFLAVAARLLLDSSPVDRLISDAFLSFPYWLIIFLSTQER